MRKTTRQQVRREAAKHEADIDFDDDTMLAWTPSGKVWNDNSSHVMSQPFADLFGQDWRSDAYKEMIDRMQTGTRDCADASCEFCR